MVGLVVEGGTDVAVIQQLVKSELLRRGKGKVAFKLLQPQTDATGSTQTGGWAKVVGWCLGNTGDGVDTYFAPTTADDVPCDIIIVHLDSDIIVDCLKKSSIQCPEHPSKVVTLVDRIRSALDEWLDLDQSRRDRFAYAVAVFKTENWILATRPECDAGRWDSFDAKNNLRRLFDPAKYSSVKNMVKSFINDIPQNRDIIHGRSVSYRIFSSDIERAKIS
jgi:hypothetical protein